MSGSGPQKPPPPILSSQSSSDAGSKGAQDQLEMLCRFLLKEFLNNSSDESSKVFDAYGDNHRDLYDNIIHAINKSPDTMITMRKYSRTNNIFNEHAGIILSEREFTPPPGVKVFKAIGEINPDGVYGAYPSLTPVKAPPALSPDSKRVVRFPPGTDPNDTKGVVSPSSPQQPVAMNWPPAQRTQGKGSRGNKIPCDTRDVRTHWGRQCPPA